MSNIKNVQKKEGSKSSKKKKKKETHIKVVTSFLKCKAKYPKSSNKKILSFWKITGGHRCGVYEVWAWTGQLALDETLIYSDS